MVFDGGPSIRMPPAANVFIILYFFIINLLIDSETTKFYAAANAIYSRVKFASEMTALYLF